MQPMTSDAQEPPMEDMGGTPMDQIISRVDEYIANPKMVTPQTLQELRMELEDLKGIVDGEEQDEPAGPPAKAPGGLAQMIGGK